MAFRLKLFSKGCVFACIGRTLSGIQQVRGSIPLISTKKKKQVSEIVCLLFL